MLGSGSPAASETATIGRTARRAYPTRRSLRNYKPTRKNEPHSGRFFLGDFRAVRNDVETCFPICSRPGTRGGVCPSIRRGFLVVSQPRCNYQLGTSELPPNYAHTAIGVAVKVPPATSLFPPIRAFGSIDLIFNNEVDINII